MKIFAVNKNNELNLYISNSGGCTYFLTTHRRNEFLWSLLKDGMKIDELRWLKPNGNRKRQRVYGSVQHILKIIDSFFQYDLQISV